MGTSTSYTGPGDTTPLLPPWATKPLPPVPAPQSAPAGDGPAPDATPESPAAAPSGSGDETASATRPGQSPLPTVVLTRPRPPTAVWRAAKRRMGKVATGGGQGAIRGAARAYVRARGGARSAARSARASRAATVALGGFLSDVDRRGFADASQALGIAVLGKDAESVFAAIVDAIAPDGSRPEEAAGRQGIVEALWQLYDRLSLADDGWAKLEAMNTDAVSTALETAIVACIYSRWIHEVGIALERKAPTPRDAVRRERDIKDYVRQSVRLDFKNKDMVAINWQGQEGRSFIESKYIEAYGIFEGS